MSITIRDLLARVMMYRPDLDDAKGMFALLEAARRLGQQASIFRFPSIHNALTIGKREVEVGVETQFKNADGNFYRVENIAIADIPEGLTYAGAWDAETNMPYLGEIFPMSMPDRWEDVNTSGDPAPSMTDPVTHYYNGKIMMYGPAMHPTLGVNKTAIKVYDVATNSWNPVVLWLTSEDFTRSQPNEPASNRLHPVSDDGHALIFGGLPLGAPKRGTLSSASWVYDFNTHTVVVGPDCSGINNCAVVSSYQWKMFDGKIIVYGQTSESGWPAKSLAIWDPVMNVIQYSNPIDTNNPVYFNPLNQSPLPTLKRGIGNDSTGKYLLMAFFGVDNNKMPIYDYVNDVWLTDIVPNVGSFGTTLTNPESCVSYAYGDSIFWTGGTRRTPLTAMPAVYKTNVTTGVTTSVASIPDGDDLQGIAYIGKYSPEPTDTRIIFGKPTANWRFDMSKNTIKPIVDAQYPTRNIDFSYAYDGYSTYLFDGGTTYEKFSPESLKNSGNYWTVSKHGTTTKGEYSQWDTGDVIYNDGKEWHRIRLDEFVYIPQVNDPGINRPSSSAEFGDGIPQSWWQRNGSVFFTVRPKKNYPVRFDVSYSPVGNEAASLPIPAECESVLTDGALSMLYMIPGQGMNAQLGQMADMRFKKGIATVRAIGMFGYGGTPSYTTGTPFGPQWNTVSINWMER